MVGDPPFHVWRSGEGIDGALGVPARKRGTAALVGVLKLGALWGVEGPGVAFGEARAPRVGDGSGPGERRDGF